MISFNPQVKVTKRHMDELAKYVPVKEYGYPRKYWVSGREYKTRKSACDQMLHLFQNFVDNGIVPAAAIDEVLTATSSQYQTPLFVVAS